MLRGVGPERPRAVVVVGTRPDAIKLAPVIRALGEPSSPVHPVVVATAQHRQMLDQVLDLFHIVPDFDLDVMRPNQKLTELTSRILEGVERVMETIAASILLVQGDTTTAFAAGLAAFYCRIPVAHVEAGLRTYDLTQPFPEEASRRLLSAITDVHLAPTPSARANLLKESIPYEKIVVTGNTVIDALHGLAEVPRDIEGTGGAENPCAELGRGGAARSGGRRILLVTSHRRESWGRDLENICLALLDIVRRFDDVTVIYPAHLNPNVQEAVRATLSGNERVHLLPPVDYWTFTNLMRRAYLVLSDSGGVEEEAATFHKPLLCLRRKTDRPEACERGLAKVVGTSREAIVKETERLLTDPGAYRAMTRGENPYGDGRAAGRIVEALSRWLRGEQPLLEPDREFEPSDADSTPYRERGELVEVTW